MFALEIRSQLKRKSLRQLINPRNEVQRFRKLPFKHDIATTTTPARSGCGTTYACRRSTVSAGSPKGTHGGSGNQTDIIKSDVRRGTRKQARAV